MTGILSAFWRVSYPSPPSPLRHCSRCGEDRSFQCSGKVRLNANGRRLDGWLIYRCTVCDATWNLPVLERVAVQSVSPPDLRAMQQSEPRWVAARAFDLALLSRHGNRVELPSDLLITKGRLEPPVETWREIALSIDGTRAPGARLDRVLALGLGLPRSGIAGLFAEAGLVVDGSPGGAARRIGGRCRIRLIADRMTEAERASVIQGIAG